MKNLNKYPSSVKLDTILNEIATNSDYTTTFAINSENEKNITLCIADIKDNYFAVAPQLLVPQNDLSYHNIYNYYNTTVTDIVAVSGENITNYPTGSQFPRPHDDQTGLDGTISISDNFIIDDSCLDTAPAAYVGYDEYHYPLYFSSNETHNGYKLINTNTDLNKIKTLCTEVYQDNKYGYLLDTLIVDYAGYLGEINSYPKSLNYYNDVVIWNKQNEACVYWKLPDTRYNARDNSLLEWTITYEFNDKKWINVIKGFLYNLHTNISKYIYSQQNQSTRYSSVLITKYYMIQALRVDSASLTNKSLLNTNQPIQNDIDITVYSWNDIITEWVPVGSRSFNDISIINLEQLVNIRPTKTNKIKMVCTQKPNYIGSPPDDITERDVPSDGDLCNSEFPIQYPRLCAASQFLPGFDVDLITSDKAQLHYTYDTKALSRNKPILANIPNTKFVEGRSKAKTQDHYAIINNISFDTTTNNLHVSLNDLCFKHSDIIGNNAISSVTIDHITFDYNTSVHDDATVLSTYNHIGSGNIDIVLNNIGDLNRSFINIKINYQPNLDSIIKNIINSNLYNDSVNNFEYHYRIPQLNNKKQILMIKTWKYDATSSDEKVVSTGNTNYFFMHPASTKFIIDSTITETIKLQISQIGDMGVINEHWIDGTTFIDNYSDITSGVSLIDGTNIIDLSNYTITNDTKYLMIFCTKESYNWTNKTEYDATSIGKQSFNYTLPTVTEFNDSITGVDNVKTIISNKDVYHYKIWYTKVVE